MGRSPAGRPRQGLPARHGGRRASSRASSGSASTSRWTRRRPRSSGSPSRRRRTGTGRTRSRPSPATARWRRPTPARRRWRPRTPTLAALADIGDSWDKVTAGGPAGYDLFVLELTNSSVPGPKPVLLVSAAIHAREYTTAEAALRFAEWILGAYGTDADATWVLDHHEIHLVLHANPDGRKQAETGGSWRKNRQQRRRLRQHSSASTSTATSASTGAAWGGSSSAACDETYRGSAAASEPETQALAAYMATVFPDRRPDDLTTPAPDDTMGIYVDLHSYCQRNPLGLGADPLGDLRRRTAAFAPNCAQILRLGRKWALSVGLRSARRQPLPGGRLDQGLLLRPCSAMPGYTWEMGTNFFESCSASRAPSSPTRWRCCKYAMRVPRTPYLTPAGPDASSASRRRTPPVAPGDPAVVTATLDDTRYRDRRRRRADPADRRRRALPRHAALGRRHAGRDERRGRHASTRPSRRRPGPSTPARSTPAGTCSTCAAATPRTTGAPSRPPSSTVLDPATAPYLEGTVTRGRQWRAAGGDGRGRTVLDELGRGHRRLLDSGARGDLRRHGDRARSRPGHRLRCRRWARLQTVIRDFALAPYVAVLDDTVESGNLGWTAQAPWAITTAQAHSPTHAWTDSPAGSYGNNVNSSLTSSAIDLSAATGVELSFWQRYATEPGFDFCHLEISATNGTTWSEIATFDGTNTTWTQADLRRARRSSVRPRRACASGSPRTRTPSPTAGTSTTSRSARPSRRRPACSPTASRAAASRTGRPRFPSPESRVSGHLNQTGIDRRRRPGGGAALEAVLEQRPARRPDVGEGRAVAFVVGVVDQRPAVGRQLE